MDSDFPWVTVAEYPKHTFNLPGFCGWVNKRDPEDHIPGHHPWDAAPEGWAPSLAVLLCHLAGALCILTWVSEVGDDWGAREFWWSQHQKRKTEELILLGNHRGRLSRNVFLPNSLHCFRSKWCVYFFPGATFNAGSIRESAGKLTKQYRCWFRHMREGSSGYILELSLLKIHFSSSLTQKLSSHAISFSPDLGNSQ